MRGAYFGTSGYMDAEAFPVAHTFSGPVRGRKKDGVLVFQGIRYGAPPLASDRFKPSRRPLPWSEPADALAFGNSAMQMVMEIQGEGARSPVTDALAPILSSPDDRAHESEDCLFLNVWTPATNNDGKRPVMVWLHGGGFVAGSASWPVYDGAALARGGDVVVVSINHRLNILGFLYLGEFAGPAYLQSGNAGMLDIMLAIWWVRDNISNFGGDAANVTVFGESGGGFKVSTLLGMRSARGLVHKAVIQNGPFLRCVTRETASATCSAILAKLGLSLPRDMERLTALPARTLIEAAEAARKKCAADERPFQLAPVIDGMTIDAHPFDPVATPLGQMVPLLIGHTRDEGTFAGTSTIAERKAAQEAPVYVYRLDWRTSVLNGVLGATHALDVPLVFGTLDAARDLVGSGPEPVELSEKMQTAWLKFARSGNPANEHVPEWPAYKSDRRATMIFDTECRLETDPFPTMRRSLKV